MTDSPAWLQKAKFTRQCRKDRHGCWIRPKAKRNPSGYDVNGMVTAWRLWHGENPQGFDQREHVCGRGGDGCVNPYHMTSVSASENRFRAEARTRGQMSRKQLRAARWLHDQAVR